MAITWGARVAANNYPRMGIELWMSPASVVAGTSQVTVYAAYYTDSLYAVADNQTLNRTGTLTGTHNYYNGGGQIHIGTWSVVVNTSFTGPQTLSFGAYQSGHYAGLSPSVTASITIPQRPVYPPNAPPSASVARVSDTQHTVSWTTNYTDTAGGYPWNGVYVERWNNVSNTWSQVASVGWATTSWSDASTVANRRYRYRVRSHNNSGTSGYTYTGYVATTPAAPTGVSAVKDVSDIDVTWVNPATYDTAVEVWHAAGGVWDGAAIATLAADATSWTHVSPDPAATHKYRVRTVTDGPLYSAYSSDSNTIQLLINPAAPSSLSSLVAVDADEPVTVAWQHNPVDSTAQTAYEVQYRLVGAGSWTSTGKVTSASSQHTIAGGTLVNGESYEWQVRTWGQYAVEPSYSPWSATAGFVTSQRPTATINSPDGTVDTSTVTVVWAFYDSEASAQAQWRAVLYDAVGVVLESRQGVGPATTWEFTTSVSDGASYSVGVQVQDAAGLWSAEDTQAFTVSYALPPVPTLTAAWVEDVGAVVVTIVNPAYEVGQADTDHNQVWRSINSGPWVLIADNVPPNGAVTDYLPVIGGLNEYRAVAFSTLPSTAPSAGLILPVTSTQGWVWLNAGPGFATMCRLRDNATLTTRAFRAKTLNHFAGREYPVETAGQARTRTVNLSARIAPGSATAAELDALADFPAPACYRDATGRRWFVSLGEVGSSHRGVVQEVDITLTQVDHVE